MTQYFKHRPMRLFLSLLIRVCAVAVLIHPLFAQNDARTLRVFILAGQSNMVGSDSKVADIGRFPPFSGLDQPQPNVMFSYCIGRENKTQSDGWVDLQPVNNVVRPELSLGVIKSG